jgi:hypothetical protein
LTGLGMSGMTPMPGLSGGQQGQQYSGGVGITAGCTQGGGLGGQEEPPAALAAAAPSVAGGGDGGGDCAAAAATAAAAAGGAQQPPPQAGPMEGAVGGLGAMLGWDAVAQQQQQLAGGAIQSPGGGCFPTWL